MDRGTYVAASGGLIQQRKLEIVNNNLANVNTPGFKREYLVTESQQFEQTLASAVAKNDPYALPDHERTPGAVNPRSVTDFSQGPIQYTGQGLDVALRNPRDFFVVNTSDGVQYTRAGTFGLNAEGELITPDGFPVQGDGGAIAVSGPGATISGDGSVLVNGRPIAKLQVVRIENPSNLERTGGTRFKQLGRGTAPETVEPDLVPSSVEMSNVSTVNSVIDLITTNRAFEMYTKTAQAIDQMNQVAISQVGRPR